MERDEPLRSLVDLARDADIAESTHRIVRAMRPALIFLNDRNAVRVVGVRPHPCGIVERQFEIISKFRPGQAFRRILVIERCPLTGKIDLRKCGLRQKRANHAQEKHDPTAISWSHSGASITSGEETTKCTRGTWILFEFKCGCGPIPLLSKVSKEGRPRSGRGG